MTPELRRQALSFALFLATVTLVPEALPEALAETPPPPPVQEIGVDERVGERIALDQEFTDVKGTKVRLGDYFGDGKPVLLVMAYSRCAMLCSLVLRGVTDVLARSASVPGDDYRVITVSIDPGEKPHEASRKQDVVLQQLGYAGQIERWPFLTGEEPAIRALATSIGFRYAWDPRTEQYAHPAVIVVLTPEGVISRYVHGVKFIGPEIDAALLAARAGHTNAAEDSDGILACFRFAAVLGEYGPIIQKAFQGGALLVLGTLLGVVVFLFRRERGRP